MYVIAGLGNPDKKYRNTKHNVGFSVIDRLSEMYGIPVTTKKFRSLIGTGIVNGEKFILVKPQTYMNLSGEAIRAVMEFYDVPVENLVVICDDVQLDVGVLRIRPKGSAGGHNGLKNIILQLATDSFKRVRVGVGKQPEGMDLVSFVLSNLTPGESRVLKTVYDDAANASVEIFFDGAEAVMSRYNGKRA
jgi:PTH1 family peptidyl-tRNA hydrolase